MNIGWVGTGLMGAPMAEHLLRAGHALRVHTRTRARADDLVRAGATWCDTPAETARGAEVSCVMVGYPSDVEAVVLGPNGLLQGGEQGSVIIDFTTSSPALARQLADAGVQQGVAVLDAPVSGGDVGARDATLSIMVGGEQDAFDQVAPLLETLGKTVVRQGAAGSGQHAKMVNQILIATSMIGVCEGLLYARRAGLDPETVLASVGGGAAASWSLSNLLPRILKGDLEPGFVVEHFVKDMEIALAECERMNLALPGLKLARELYGRLVEMGGGKRGTQALILALDALGDT
jgi:3-hydroxyisobutyrate dehydrogenase